MSRARSLALLAAAALPVTAVPALAAAPPTPVLAATTVVSTSTSGHAEVFLPSEAEVSTRTDRGVQLRGKGRMVGVWLDPVDGGSGFLGSYRLPAFAGSERATYGSAVGSGAAQRVVLPRGRYRITVLADGAPVRVELRLAGAPAGTRRVALERLRSTQRELPVREAAGATALTYGATADVGPDPVTTYVVARPRWSSGGHARVATSCQRHGATDVPFAYAAHCPGGTATGYSYESAELSGAGAFGSSSEQGGPIGLGGSFADDGGVSLVGALGVWLQRP